MRRWAGFLALAMSMACVPGHAAETWPTRTISLVNAELRALVGTEDVTKRIHAEGGDPLTSTPEEYAADVEREGAKWGTLIRKLNLKVE